MKIKRIAYIGYISIIGAASLFQFQGVWDINMFIAGACGTLILCMLVTRVPLLSHRLSGIGDVERLANEQRSHPFLPWKDFIFLLLPMMGYLAVFA